MINVNYQKAALGDDCKYWSAAEIMPPKEMKNLQLKRLIEQVNYCWERSPFYREIWEKNDFHPSQIKTLEDIRRIPFTTKDAIRQDQEKYPPYGKWLVPGQKPINRIAMTSGTTGEPVLIPFTAEDYFSCWCEGVVRALWAAGVRKEDVVHAAFGFTPFIGLAGAYDSCEHLIGALVIPGGSWDSKIRLNMIKKLGITVLMGTVTYILRLGRMALEEGIDPRKLGVRVIFTTGEPGPMSVPNTAIRLKELWGSDIYEFSGTQETEYFTWLCEEGAGHLNEDLVYFEVLDPDTKEPVEPGQPGEMVVTDLVQKTHPLLRFPTGDIVEGIVPSSCACGRTLSIFKGFRGRIGDIIKVRGVSVSVSGIENVIRKIEECSDNYEYIASRDQGGMDKIKVRVEPRHDLDKELWTDLRQKLSEALRMSFMINMEVEVVPPGTLPVYEHKSKRFFDKR